LPEACLDKRSSPSLLTEAILTGFAFERKKAEGLSFCTWGGYNRDVNRWLTKIKPPVGGF